MSCHVVCGSDLTRRIIRDGITIMLDVLVPVSWVGPAVVLVLTVLMVCIGCQMIVYMFVRVWVEFKGMVIVWYVGISRLYLQHVIVAFNKTAKHSNANYYSHILFCQHTAYDSLSSK